MDQRVTKRDRIRFATYNILGGMKGDKIIRNALNHFYLHVLKSAKRIKKRSEPFSNIVPIIKKSHADILCLNEVFHSIQKHEIYHELKKLGYKTITIGKSVQHLPPLDFSTVLASKYPAKKINVRLDQFEGAGGGGGAVALYIPEKNMTVVGLHLAVPKKLRDKQLKELVPFVKKQKYLGRKVILMGDFNATTRELKNSELFSDLGFKGSEYPTFPTFTKRIWVKRDLDHIVHGPNFTMHNIEVIKGYSDHYLLTCEIN